MIKRGISILLAGALVMSMSGVTVLAESLPASQPAQEAPASEAEERINGVTAEVLTITNNTGMFKAASASLETDENGTVLKVALSGTSYEYLIPGTYEEAVAAGYQKDSWLAYSVNADGKYEFAVPVTADLASGPVEIPMVSVSKSKLSAYEEGSGTLEAAFYPRLFVLDMAEKTLVTDDYKGTMALTVENSIAMLKVNEASVYTVGGPNSNTYANTLTLVMNSNAYDKMYLGAGDQVVEEAVVPLAVSETDGLSRFVIDIPKDSMETAVNAAFHSAKKDRWYTRKITVSRAEGKLILTDNAADYTAVDEALATVPADLSGYTEESAAAVEQAVAAVVYGKAADEPGAAEAIAAMAEAITNAVANLTEKPAADDFGFTCQASFWDESKAFATVSFTDVTVRLTDSEGNVIIEETSPDVVGLYSVNHLDAAKTYTLELSREGYAVAEKGEWNTALGRYEYTFTGEDVYSVQVTAENDGNNFIGTFVQKPQALADALAMVPADLSIFTDSTAAALTAAVEAADEKETAESVVNAMAEAIVAAVQALIPRDGVYEAAKVTTDKLSTDSRRLYVKDGQMYLKCLMKSLSYDRAYAGTAEAAPEDEIGWILPNAKNGTTSAGKEACYFVFPVASLSTVFDTACRSASKQTWYGYSSIVEAASLTPTDELNTDPYYYEETLRVTNMTAMFKVAEASLGISGDGSRILNLSIASTSYPYLVKGLYDDVLENGYDPDNWIAGTPAEVLKNDVLTAGYRYQIPVLEDETLMNIIAVSGSHLTKYLAGTEDLGRSLFGRYLLLDAEAMTLETGDYHDESPYTLKAADTRIPASAAVMTTVGTPASNNYAMTLTLSFTEDTLSAFYIGTAEAAAAAEAAGETTVEVIADRTLSVSLRKNLTGGTLACDYLDQVVTVSFKSADGWFETSLFVDTENRSALIGEPERRFVTVAGDTRYETACAIAVSAYETAHGAGASPDTVILVKGNDFPDALSANAYAGVTGLPILLTSTARLSEPVRTLLTGRWDSVKNVVFIGRGFASAVTDSLKACGVTGFRTIAGANRYETAAAVFDAVIAADPTVDTVLVATGAKAADALSASAMSYSEHYPVLLAHSNGAVDAATLDRIRRAGIKNVILLGSEATVSSEAAAGKTSVRLGGRDRYETSRLIADYYTEECGASITDGTGFAHGSDAHYPDALVGGQLMGQTRNPILLISDSATYREGVTDYVRAAMGGSQSAGSSFYFLGYVGENKGNGNFAMITETIAAG